MVHSLLTVGHPVTVGNHTASRADEVVAAGVLILLSLTD